MEVSASAPSEIQELEKPETENLKLLKNAVSDYQQAQKTQTEAVSQTDIDGALAIFGATSRDFIPNGTAVNSEKLNAFLNTLEESPRNVRLSGEIPSFQEQYREALAEYKAIVISERYLFSPMERKMYGETYSRMDKLRKRFQYKTLVSLGNRARELFEEDALKETNLPNKQINRIGEAIIQMSTAVCSPELKTIYEPVINQIYQEQQNYTKPADFEKTFYRITPRSQDEKVNLIVYSFGQYFNKEEWESLEATPEQTRALCDAVREPFFTALRDYPVGFGFGMAARFFAVMRDPLAIPALLDFIRRPHDNYGAAGIKEVFALEKIINNPSSREDLEKVIEQSSPLDRHIITEWIQNKESLFALSGKYVSVSKVDLISEAPKYFVTEKLARLAETIAKRQGVELSEDDLLTFFGGRHWNSTTKIEELLIKELGVIAPVIAATRNIDWRIFTPVIYKALVHPENGNYAWFPELIGKEGLGISAESLAKLRNLYNSRDLRVGIMARNIMAEGLLFLSTKDNGKEIAESILGFVTGAREDSARVREAFRLLQTLDGLGEFSYDPKANLQETIADLKGRVVTAVAEKMELGEDEKAAVSEKLPYLVESNVVEIIPSLLSQMNKLSRTSEEKVVREIGRHIVLGDFKSWREGLETSREQLEVLPEDKRKAWLEPVPEVVLSVQAQKGAEARQAVVDAVKRIVSEARAHVQDVYKVDFSPDRARQLGEMQKTLIGEIKASSSENEKKDLGVRKRSVDAELRLIEGFVQLESASPDSLKPQNILSIVAKTKSAMGILSGLDQPMRDLEQIEKVFTTQEKLETVERLQAYDSDDPVALLKAGIEPRETCQSWRGGAYNYCLPAYVTDANKRVFNVEDERGEVLGRAIAKLTHIQTAEKQKQPAILLEPVYATSETPDIYRAIIRLALEKAEAIGAVLVVGREIVVATGADSSKTVSLLPQEAAKAGFNSGRRAVSVYLPPSHNTYEYSDTLGGLMSRFGEYHRLDAEVLGKQA